MPAQRANIRGYAETECERHSTFKYLLLWFPLQTFQPPEAAQHEIAKRNNSETVLQNAPGDSGSPPIIVHLGERCWDPAGHGCGLAPSLCFAMVMNFLLFGN